MRWPPNILDLPRRASAAIGKQSLLLSNASYLAFGPAVSAVVGAAFWLITARHATPETQGIAAAAISAMNFTAYAGELGLHMLLMGHAARYRDQSVVAAGLIMGAFVATGLAVAFVLAASHVAPTLGRFLGETHVSALFIAGAGITAFSTTLDGCLQGLFAGRIRMCRELVSSGLKIAALISVFACVGALRLDFGIVLAWTVGVAGSVAFALVMAELQNVQLWQRPAFSTLGQLAPKLAGHHLLNLAALAPTIAFPVVVAEVLSPAVNAAFYITWMLLQAVLLAPAGFATALYPIGASDPERIASRLKISVVTCVVIGLLAGVACYLAIDTVLWLINPAFVELSGSSMSFIGFSAVALSVKYHYIAIMRLTDRMASAALVLAICSVVELSTAALAGRSYGLEGLTLAWLAVISLQTIALLPTVLSAMSEDYWRDRHASGAHSPGSAVTPLRTQRA